MSDRELLELAAKAYGCKGLEWREGSQCFYYDDPDTGREQWYPIGDDGQAFRLAVKLEIEWKKPSKSRSSGRVIKAWYPPAPGRVACWSAMVGVDGNRRAATRHVIVLCAAAIGKAMP